MDDLNSPRDVSKYSHMTNEIELDQLLGQVWQRRLWVATVTLVVVVMSGVYTFSKWPSYQSQAMLQIDSGRDAFNLLSELPFAGEGLNNEYQATRDILKSRTVLGNTARDLNLDVEVLPDYFPLLSGWLLKKQNTAYNEKSQIPGWLPDSYAWVGESVKLEYFEVPSTYIGAQLYLSVEGEKLFNLYDHENNIILNGRIGESVTKNGFSIHVSELKARTGVWFKLRKLNVQDVIASLQESIQVKGGKRQGDGIIKVIYRHHDAVHAARILNTVIKHYVMYNISSQTAVTEKTLLFVESQLEKFSKDLSFNNDLYLMLLTKAHELKVMKAGTLGNVRVVDKAFVPIRPEGMGMLPMMAITALLGLVLGMIAAIIRHYMDHALYDPGQIESNLNIPVYATIPLSQAQIKLNKQGWKISGNGNISQGLLYKDVPDDPAMEAIRFLRTMIEDGDLRSKHNVIAITGPSPNVGKTFLSTNLTCLLSELGLRVLLIDADLRRGVVHEYFALEKECGLADYLMESVTIESIVKYSGIGQMDVITRGGSPDNPSVLMSSSRLQLLLDECKQNYDIIIIDTPPALAVTDATIIARHVDQLLMVIKAGLTTMDEVSVCWKRLTQSGKRPSGLVMSGYDPSKLGYSKYQQYGYY